MATKAPSQSHLADVKINNQVWQILDIRIRKQGSPEFRSLVRRTHRPG